MTPQSSPAQTAPKQPPFSFNGFNCGLHPVAFSPDGKMLAVAATHSVVKSPDGSDTRPSIVGKVLLFDFPSGGLRHALETPDISVNRVAFSADSKRVIAGCGCGDLFMWDTASGKTLFALYEAYQLSVSDLCLTKDGKRLVTRGSGDQLLKVWDLPSGKLLITVRFPFADNRATSFRLPFRDRDRAPITITYPQPVTELSCVRFSPDEKSLLVGTNTNKVLFLDPKTGEVQRTLKTRHKKSAYEFEFMPDGHTLATMEAPFDDDDKVVHLWDVRTSKFLGILGRGASLAGDFAFSPDGKTLVSGQGFIEGTVKICDYPSGRVRFTIGNKEKECITHYALSPDGKVIAAILYGKPARLRFWDTATGKEISPASQKHKPRE